MSRDPVNGQQNQPQTWNQYSYGLNNPASRVDPTGRDSEMRGGSGIPRPCIHLVINVILSLLSPGLLFAVPVPLLLPLQIMYVYTAAFVVTTQLLEAAAAADTKGQAVGSIDLASEISQALGQSRMAGFLAGAPGLTVDFLECRRAI